MFYLWYKSCNHLLENIVEVVHHLTTPLLALAYPLVPCLLATLYSHLLFWIFKCVIYSIRDNIMCPCFWHNFIFNYTDKIGVFYFFKLLWLMFKFISLTFS